MMIEPCAAAERPVAELTPEEAGAEITQTRGNADHDWRHEGRPGFDAAQERVMQLYQRAHSSTEPSGEPGLAPPEATRVRLDVFDGQYAPPQTAAELDAVPPPELSPAIVKAGLRWDDGMLRAVNAAAEREGVTAFVLAGRHAIARAASGPPVDPVDALHKLRVRWGSAFDRNLESAHLGLEALPSAARAGLEARNIDFHPDVMEEMRKVGEALMDPTTPGGMRRLKTKYSQRTGD